MAETKDKAGAPVLPPNETHKGFTIHFQLGASGGVYAVARYLCPSGVELIVDSEGSCQAAETARRIVQHKIDLACTFGERGEVAKVYL